MKKYLIKVNGTQYEVEVDEIREENAAFQPQAEVRTVSAPAAAPAPVSAPAPKPEPKKDTAVPAGATKVTAPMPGTILKVNVNTGDVVKKGQVLLILEAMKMENEIVAPNDATVSSINVSKGTSVNAGDILLSLS